MGTAPAFPDTFAGGAAAFPTDAITPPYPPEQFPGGGAASPFAALQTVSRARSIALLLFV